MRGFTLLEALIVIGLIVILTAIGVFSFQAFRANADLNAAQDVVLASLRTARSRTLASENLSVHGAHFDAQQVVLFLGGTYDPNAGGNEPRTIPASITIENINVSSWPDVTFARITGQSSGMGKLRLQHASGRSRDIAVRLFSETARQEGLPPELLTRIEDTRHVHFDLGWSLRDMENLVLTFRDNNNNAVVQTIALASYFVGSPPTALAWEGMFMVDGMEQHLRINTHLLTDTDTVLSVHRSRFENTKPVNVSFTSSVLGTRNVATYNSRGEFTLEADGGVATVQ